MHNLWLGWLLIDDDSLVSSLVISLPAPHLIWTLSPSQQFSLLPSNAHHRGSHFPPLSQLVTTRIMQRHTVQINKNMKKYQLHTAQIESWTSTNR